MSEYVIAKYLRLSSEDVDLKQSDKLESNSISNQRNLLDSYINSIPEFSGAKVIEFCDDGWSGKNFERPAFQEMLTQIRAGKINCIIVKDLSRFGRDYLTVGNYISRIFPFMGVRFIAVNDGFDSIRPMDTDSLDTSFKTLLYDLYSRELSRKVRSAKRFRAQKGYCVASKAPYGYMKDPDDKNRLIIDPPAAEVVRRIFHMVAEGNSAVQTARALNDEHIQTPMLYKVAAGCYNSAWLCIDGENFWTGSAIIRIVRNECYIGKAIYGKRYTDVIGSGHSKKVKRENWIVVENMHEAIVSKEEFDRAQDRLERFSEHNVKSGGLPLTGKVKCGICGRAMRRRRAKQSYFYCGTPLVTDNFSCTTERTLEEDVLSAIRDGLHTMAAAAVELSLVQEEQSRSQKKDISRLLGRLSALKEAAAQRKQQVKELYETYALGEMGRDEYLERKTALQNECDGILTEISNLEASIESTDTDGEQSCQLIERLKQYTDVQELTREIVEDVVKEVRIYPGRRMEIVWNCQDEFEKLADYFETDKQSEGEIAI